MATILDSIRLRLQPAYRAELSARRAARNDDARRHALYALYGMGQQLSSAGIAGDPVDVLRHPILTLTSRTYAAGPRHDLQLAVFHAMRQYCPTLDAAIKNRRTLEGDAHIESDDEGLAEALNEFVQEVPVGYIGGGATLRGLNTYANVMADNADEYGLSAGEMLTDEQGREILRLVVPNARTLALRDEDGDGIHELYQTQRGQMRRIDDAALVQTLSFTASAEAPWPYPLAWSLVKSTEAVMRMFEAVINGWWRFGDPSLLNIIEYDADATPERMEVPAGPGSAARVEVPNAIITLKESLEAVMAARRGGRVGDAYAYVDGGRLRSETLGSIDQTITRYFVDHASIFDGHIIAQSRTPVWMYPSQQMRGEGLGSQLSQNEALVASVDARKRNRAKERLMKDVIDTMLLLEGDAQYIGRYEIAFDEVSILDDKVEAEAMKTRAEAEAQIIENAVQLYDDETGARRFQGEAEQYLVDHEILRQ